MSKAKDKDVQIFQLQEQVNELKEKLSRKTNECENKDKKMKETIRTLEKLTKDITSYQAKNNEKKKQLEKMLYRCHQIIDYFHNACVVLGK